MSKQGELPLEITAAGRYAELEQDRSPYLDRGRECAVLTIPAVLPPQGFGKSSKLPTPYQSLGARGARTLASKLLLSLYPTVPFFNYRIDDQALQKLAKRRGEIEKALASRERAVTTELDICVFRPAAFMALLHLVIVGNALVYIPPKQEERAQVYRLDQYVTRRDAAGNLLEFVIHETMDFASVPLEVRAAIAGEDKYKDGKPLEKKEVNLFTHGYIDEKSGFWIVYQEAEGIRIPGTVGKFKPDELPYIALRFSTQPGENYGRSYVEEYLGDLDSLEALSEALVEGSAAAARIVFLVDPGGTTSIQIVSKAKNGDVVSGNAQDVTTLKVEKANDLSVAKSQAEEIASRLSYAFLLHSSVQRAGERVTAEEIRYVASELDDGLGGVYTLLAADFQKPSVRLFERRMEKRLGVLKLPKNIVTPIIVAGLEAIGRGHSQKNLRAFVTEILQVLPPEIAFKRIKIGELIERSAAAYGVDTEGLIATDEEIAEQEQAEMEMAMTQMGGPEMIKQAGGLANTALKGAIAPPPQAPKGT